MTPSDQIQDLCRTDHARLMDRYRTWDPATLPAVCELLDRELAPALRRFRLVALLQLAVLALQIWRLVRG